MEERLGDAASKVKPLTIHWSGCSAGCGLHQAATVGLQGCRSRQPTGEIVDAAHVFVNGSSGPGARVGMELLNDVPCSELADAMMPLVKFLAKP